MTRDSPPLVQRYFLGDSLGAFLGRALAGSGAVHLAAMLVTFLVGIQLARGLGVESYGHYGIAMAAIAVASIPGEFGLPKLVTREVAAASARADLPRLFGVLRWADRTATSLSLAAALAIAIGAFAVAHQDASPVAMAIAVGAPIIPLVALAKIRGAALQGLQFVVLGQVPTSLLRPLVMAILLLVLFTWFPEAHAPEAMALNVVAAAVALIFAHLWLRRRLPRSRPASLVQNGRPLLASAFPMALTDGMRLLQSQLVILLIGLLASAEQVGLFRIADATAIMVAIPIVVVNSVTAPILARLHAEADLRRLRLLCSRTARLTTAGVLALSLPIFLFGSGLIGLVFGAEYRPASPALVILCIGQILHSAFGPNGNLLVMSGHERRVTRATAISLVIGTVMQFALVPWMGIIGAAVAMSLSLLAWNLIAWTDARRLLGVDTSLVGARVAEASR